MTALGPLMLLAALVSAIYAAGASGYGHCTGRTALVQSGRRAALSVTALIGLASLALLYGLFVHDFHYVYVAEHSSLVTPWYYRLSSFYSGQQGSLLYWALILSIFSAVVIVREPKRFPELIPFVTATLMSVEIFMLIVLVFVAGPFERLSQPLADGQGLNPLLQDPGMLIHPPMLLAGLASWSVPFAFVVAALVSGRLNSEWIRATRPYALIAWGILGIGNLLGAWWAYHVLGWGGYWGWDPVENAAIMPWFVGTAYLHSVMVQERRGMLKVWNVGLLMLAFALSIFGTFVVRSGILTSVHSFAQSSIGPFFFGFLLIVLAVCLWLIYWRMPRLQSENGIDSAVSREGAFLLNNLLFIGIVFATFWGTILPLLSDAVGGQKLTVGPPFFNQINGPIALVLLILMGVGPLLPWRRTDRARLRHLFLAPGLFAIGSLLLLWLAGIRDLLPLAGLGAAAFVVGTIVDEFWSGVLARRRHSTESIPLALARLVRRNNRRYGGYVVHLAIVMIGVGIIGSSFYKTEENVVLRPGETANVQEFSLQFSGLQHSTGPDTQTVSAPLRIAEEGHPAGTLVPTKVTHLNFAGQPPVTGVSIDTIHLKDLYIVLSRVNDNGSIDLLVFVNPLVSLIWLGGPLLLGGFLLCFWPASQPRQRSHPVPVVPVEVAVEA